MTPDEDLLESVGEEAATQTRRARKPRPQPVGTTVATPLIKSNGTGELQAYETTFLRRAELAMLGRGRG